MLSMIYSIFSACRQSLDFCQAVFISLEAALVSLLFLPHTWTCLKAIRTEQIQKAHHKSLIAPNTSCSLYTRQDNVVQALHVILIAIINLVILFNDVTTQVVICCHLNSSLFELCV